MPIYNEERYLSEALDSLLAQDYGNIEIVISDNGSTDGTQEICRAYAFQDERIDYHRQEENRGAVYNFNGVFQLSSGRYFTWASGHDTRDSSCVRVCVEVLENRPDVVLCYPRTVLVEHEGHSTNVLDDTLETVGLPPAERLKATIMQLTWCNAIYGVIRSSALSRTRLARYVVGADHVLLAELSLRGAFHQIEEPLFFRKEIRPSES